MPFTGYRITSPFGWRDHPVYNERRFHTGIDLVKSHKAPIHAFVGGTVLYAGMGKTGSGFGSYGNVVLIKDKNNRGQVYAHLDSVSVKVGQTISKGQVIGTQGNTGVSTGSHLHYEVRKTAQAGVPYGWIADRANNCLEPTAYLKSFKDVNVAATGNSIKDVQSTLNSRYNFKIAVDGKFGQETKKALIKAFQTELNKQFSAKLVVDGIWGPKTKAASINVHKGARGNIVWIIQAMLYCLGHDPKGLDHIYGNGMAQEVRAFQSKNSINVADYVDQPTFSKLFG